MQSSIWAPHPWKQHIIGIASATLVGRKVDEFAIHDDGQDEIMYDVRLPISHDTLPWGRGVGGQSVGHGHRVHTCVNSVTTVALATTSFCMAESAVWTNDCKDGKLALCDPLPDLRFL